MYNSNIYMKLSSFEINLKQNQKDIMEINQIFLLINKLNDLRSHMQQDNFNTSLDLIQIISHQDNCSI